MKEKRYTAAKVDIFGRGLQRLLNCRKPLNGNRLFETSAALFASGDEEKVRSGCLP
jgi:hypothetical protein